MIKLSKGVRVFRAPIDAGNEQFCNEKVARDLKIYKSQNSFKVEISQLSKMSKINIFCNVNLHLLLKQYKNANLFIIKGLTTKEVLDETSLKLIRRLCLS